LSLRVAGCCQAEKWQKDGIATDVTSARQTAIFSLLSILTGAYTHPFHGPLFGTTRVSRYQKGKTTLDFTEARDSEWQWHQLGHMQVCTSLQTDKNASTPPLKFFTGRMPFLPPNQQWYITGVYHREILPFNLCVKCGQDTQD